MGLSSQGRYISTVPETEGCHRTENRICALPDDLLVSILLLVPTKDAVATTILSKRWRPVWTMLPELAFKDENSKSIGWFTEKSLQLHKAPKLKSLRVELGPPCAVDVDAVKWVDKAVKNCVEKIDFKLLWTAEPTNLPLSLYTCNTLVNLTLSNEIVVDVSSPALLPSLLYLYLTEVIYKDEDSLVRLLSSCPVLQELDVYRRGNDNLTNIMVKVPSLKMLYYYNPCYKKEVEEEYSDNYTASVVIDSPALTKFEVISNGKEYFLIENMPRLEVSLIGFGLIPDDKLLKSLISVMHLHFSFTQPMVELFFCKAIKFSRLIELYFHPGELVDWLEPFMFFLHNSPKLTTLTIDTWSNNVLRGVSDSTNQPSTIPGCLSSHLEIFRWNYYGGSEDEKQLLTYIFANAKCLKTVEIYFKSTCNLEERRTEIESTCNFEERRTEIESIPRISTSTQLLFPTKKEFVEKLCW